MIPFSLFKNSTESAHYPSENWLEETALMMIIVMGFAGISALCYFERKKFCGSGAQEEKQADMELHEIPEDLEYQALAEKEDKESLPSPFRKK